MVTGLPSMPRAGWADPGNLASASFVMGKGNGHLIEPSERAVTLADLIAEHGDFDLIKLDVEGMEQEILSGAREHLARGATTLWVECNEHPQSLELAEMLLSWGLEVYYFAFPSHNPDNFRGENNPIFPWVYEAGLLVAPKHPPQLDANLTAHRCILRPIRTVESLAEAMWRTPRWLPPELAHADITEMAAFAGRVSRGQARPTFLVAETDVERTTPEETNKLVVLTESLSRAEALAIECQDELLRERERREAAEQRLATATALALARLGELGAERERAELATARIDAAEARVHAVEAQAEARVHAAEAQAEARVHAAEARAEARVHAVEAQAEARVHAAEAQAEARVHAAEAQAETQVHTAQQQLENVQALLASIRITFAWRLASPINAYITRRPRLHATLRYMRWVVGIARRRLGLSRKT
jgi:hypothetical protein